MSDTPLAAGRRPLKSRNVLLFQKAAAALARGGVSPNAISAASIVCGVIAGAAFAATAHCHGWQLRACWLVAALGIQGRLMANLLDGMVAVEGRKGGPTGDLWNEAPDRVSDAATLIGAGYALGAGPLLGYAASVVAVFVAYVRALGASVGAGQVFLGPQAKQQRMAVLTGAAVLSAVFPAFTIPLGGQSFTFVSLALWIVIVGGTITAWRRMSFIADHLRNHRRS